MNERKNSIRKAIKEIGKICIIFLIGMGIAKYGSDFFFITQITTSLPLIDTTLDEKHPTTDYSDASFLDIGSDLGNTQVALLTFKRNNYQLIRIQLPFQIYRNPPAPLQIFVFYNLSFVEDPITWATFPYNISAILDSTLLCANQSIAVPLPATLSATPGEYLVDLPISIQLSDLNLTILIALNATNNGLLRLHSLNYPHTVDDDGIKTPYMIDEGYDNFWEWVGVSIVLLSIIFIYFPKKSAQTEAGKSDSHTKNKIKLLFLLDYLILLVINIFFFTNDSFTLMLSPMDPTPIILFFDILILLSPLMVFLVPSIIRIFLRLSRVTTRKSEIIALDPTPAPQQVSIYDRFDGSLYLGRIFWIYLTVFAFQSLLMTNPIGFDFLISPEDKANMLAMELLLGFNAKFIFMWDLLLVILTPLIWIPLWWLEDQHLMFFEMKSHYPLLSPTHNTIKKIFQGLFGIGSILTYIQWFQQTWLSSRYADLVANLVVVFPIMLIFTLPLYLLYLQISNSPRFKIRVKTLAQYDAPTPY